MFARYVMINFPTIEVDVEKKDDLYYIYYRVKHGYPDRQDTWHILTLSDGEYAHYVKNNLNNFKEISNA